MLRNILIVASLIIIPLGLWIASTYGQLAEVTFEHATETALSGGESDQAVKVLIVCTVVDATGAPSSLICQDTTATHFKVDFTGKPPEIPFNNGTVVRFVGHVHGGNQPYLHATQVYAP